MEQVPAQLVQVLQEGQLAGLVLFRSLRIESRVELRLNIVH